MQQLTISNQAISTHNGLYSLTDLHKVSGSENKHKPNYFLANQETQALINEIESENQIAYDTVIGKGKKQGTYACRELVYRYAMWISPKFSLMVIRAFDALNTGAIPCLAKTTTDDRHPLTQAVKLLARTKGLSYSDAWKLVHQRFGVDNVKQLTLDQLEQAVCYVHSLLMIQNIANPEQLYDTLANSACHLREYARMLKILKHLPMTDDNTGGNIYRQITETFDDIVKLSHTMNLRNHAGRPMFEQNRINYYRGNALVWS